MERIKEMLIRDVGASLVRRWHLTIAGLLMTAGLIAVALVFVQPTFESRASVVLLPPKSAVAPGGNPYLELGGLAPTLDLVVASLNDQQTHQAMEAVSGSAEYTVEADSTSSGPVLLVSAQDTNPTGATAVRDALVREAPQRLSSMQSDLAIAARSQITSAILTSDDEPELVGRTQLRAAVVAAGAGLVGTVLLVSLVDGIFLRRRRPFDIISADDAPAVSDPQVPMPTIPVEGARGEKRYPAPSGAAEPTPTSTAPPSSSGQDATTKSRRRQSLRKTATTEPAEPTDGAWTWGEGGESTEVVSPESRAAVRRS